MGKGIKNALDDVLQYIFDSEYDDFQENPSEHHVYYKAYLLDSGSGAANKMLYDTIDKLQKEKRNN